MVINGQRGLPLLTRQEKEGYATMAEYDNFQRDKGIFGSYCESVWLLERDDKTGIIKYDLDFLQASRIVDADTFNDLMVDFEKYLKYLNIPITGYVAN